MFPGLQSGNFPTLLCTLPARRRTRLTVGNGVFLTLGGTSVTRVGAGLTQFTYQRPATSHRAQRRNTCISTITVKPDAFDHLLDVVFVKARVGAHVASHNAGSARLYAGAILLVARREVRFDVNSGHLVLRSAG